PRPAIPHVPRASRTAGGPPRRCLPDPQRAPRAAARPRPRRHDHPMPRARHPRRVGLHERPYRPQIQRPPPPTTRTPVVPRTASPTDPTLPPPPTPRPHRRDNHTLVLVELDTLNHRLLDAEH